MHFNFVVCVFYRFFCQVHVFLICRCWILYIVYLLMCKYLWIVAYPKKANIILYHMKIKGYTLYVIHVCIARIHLLMKGMDIISHTSFPPSSSGCDSSG